MTFEKIASSPADGKTHAARTVCAGFSGLVNAKRSERAAAGSPIDRGPSTWSDIVSLLCAHFATPKRDFKLSRPVLSNGDNIFFTEAGPRNCTRQSATEPLPLGVTSSVPV